MLGKDIVCFKVGSGKNKILLHGGIHAREYITTLFLLKEIKYLKQFYLSSTFYIIPAVNLDGIKLVLKGKEKEKRESEFLKIFNDETDFSLLKSNANGVDLNTNFSAFWGTGKTNTTIPGFSNFIGNRPNSEPETASLIAFTRKIMPNLTISYHAKGEVIYYDFLGLEKGFSAKQKTLAQTISKFLKYKKQKAKGSVGGYKDYCLLNLGISSFTIEVGSDNFSHPFPISELGIVFSQNKNLPLILQRLV